MTHNISELDESVKETLYSLCFDYEKEVPRDEYLRMFSFVVVDEDLYINGSPHSLNISSYYLELQKNGSQLHANHLPDAIIKNGVVIKNRYGAVAN